jgi:protein-arginine kinase
MFISNLNTFPLASFIQSQVYVDRLEKVNLGVDLGLLGSVEKIGSEWNQVLVRLRDTIETTKVHTEPEGTVFLLDE